MSMWHVAIDHIQPAQKSLHLSTTLQHQDRCMKRKQIYRDNSCAKSLSRSLTQTYLAQQAEESPSTFSRKKNQKSNSIKLVSDSKQRRCSWDALIRKKDLSKICLNSSCISLGQSISFFHTLRSPMFHMFHNVISIGYQRIWSSMATILIRRLKLPLS